MIALTSLFLGSQLFAHSLDSPVHIEVYPVETPTEIAAMLENWDELSQRQEQRQQLRQFSRFQDGIDLGEIVNLGQKIWKVIEDNQPVLDAKHLYANAIPQAVKDSREMNGFSKLQGHSFRYEGYNLFGYQVFSVVYTLVYRYGGHYEGEGAYLSSVSIIPSDVQVSWAYTLNMNVGNVHVENIGSEKNPVAGMNLEVNIDVSTVMRKSKFTRVFELFGDSSTYQAY